MEYTHLYEMACKMVKPRRISETAKIGMVACVLESVAGNIYTGICAEISCSLGFCAEQSAISAMLLNDENKIDKLIVVYRDGIIIIPCGKCRELIFHINYSNYDNTKIIISDSQYLHLKDLLPNPWYSEIANIRTENIKKMGNKYI